MAYLLCGECVGIRGTESGLFLWCTLVCQPWRQRAPPPPGMVYPPCCRWRRPRPSRRRRRREARSGPGRERGAARCGGCARQRIGTARPSDPSDSEPRDRDCAAVRGQVNIRRGPRVCCRRCPDRMDAWAKPSSKSCAIPCIVGMHTHAAHAHDGCMGEAVVEVRLDGECAW